MSRSGAIVEMVRAVSQGNVFLGNVSLDEAHRLIREKLAVGVGSKTRLIAVKMRYARVQTRPEMGGLRGHYFEEMPSGGHSVPMLKRAVDVYERRGRVMVNVGYVLERWPDREGRGAGARVAPPAGPAPEHLWRGAPRAQA